MTLPYLSFEESPPAKTKLPGEMLEKLTDEQIETVHLWIQNISALIESKNFEIPCKTIFYYEINKLLLSLREVGDTNVSSKQVSAALKSFQQQIFKTLNISDKSTQEEPRILFAPNIPTNTNAHFYRRSNSAPATNLRAPKHYKKSKRLNKSVTTRLTQWLVHHQECPFPSQEDKMELASELNITPQQVGNWMTNMRKRHLYPIISGKKKPKSDLDYLLLERNSSSPRESPIPFIMPEVTIETDTSTSTIKMEPSRKIFQLQHSSSNASSTYTSSSLSPFATVDTDDDVWTLMNTDLSPDVEDFSLNLATEL